MKVIPEMLEFFFWIYLLEVKCPRGKKESERKRRFYSDLIEEATDLFHYVVAEKYQEGFISFEKSSLTLKRESGQIIFKIEFENEKEARIYIKALKKYRDSGCDIRDHVSLSDPNPTEIKWVLKSKDIVWEAIEKAVKITVKGG